MRSNPLFRGLVHMLIMIGLICIPSPIFAQQPETQYFPETDHTVRGQFLHFFSEHGSLDVFGLPISEEIVEGGVRVQYFQNVRLEWHPENPRPYQVQPGLLGDLVGVSQPPVSLAEIPPANRPDERFYPQTGHTVKQGFLTFFDYYGGLDLFGYPISEMIAEPDGRIVQWFQRAQLEWIPNNAGGRVQLAPLGNQVFKQKYPERALELDILPVPSEERNVQAFGIEPESTASPNSIGLVMPKALRIAVSLQHAVTGGPNRGQQQVSVYVTDENDTGVPNASVELLISSEVGAQKLMMPPTDRRGVAAVSFEIGQVTPGSKVVISAQASYGTQSAATETSFLPWY